MAVITISNQFGAGGPLLGQELAKRLSLDYFDKEIIHKVALEVNVPDAQVEEFEADKHNKVKSFFSTLFDLDALKKKAQVLESAQAAEEKYDDRDKIPYQFHVDGWIDSEIYKQMIVKIITALGTRGNAVIAGRGGQHILADNPEVIHIRLVADLQDRIDRIAKARSLPRAVADEYVTTLDSRSRDYLRFYFDCDPDNPNYYHAVLNTSRMKIAQCADAVEQLLK
jgi:cytidylate kinase